MPLDNLAWEMWRREETQEVIWETICPVLTLGLVVLQSLWLLESVTRVLFLTIQASSAGEAMALVSLDLGIIRVVVMVLVV